MDENLKATITQRLEELPDETARQLLDYIEFLESKYNRSTRDRSPFERLADNVEGTLRASRIGGAAIKGTSSVWDAASSVVRGVADAGRVVVEELQKLDLSDSEEGRKKGEESASPEQGEAAQSQTDSDVQGEAKAAAGEETPGPAETSVNEPAGNNAVEKKDGPQSA